MNLKNFTKTNNNGIIFLFKFKVFIMGDGEAGDSEDEQSNLIGGSVTDGGKQQTCSEYVTRACCVAIGYAVVDSALSAASGGMGAYILGMNEGAHLAAGAAAAGSCANTCFDSHSFFSSQMTCKIYLQNAKGVSLAYRVEDAVRATGLSVISSLAAIAAISAVGGPTLSALDQVTAVVTGGGVVRCANVFCLPVVAGCMPCYEEPESAVLEG